MIVIPMAGLSSRFKQAGYDLPKYMLTAHRKTLFEYSVESFRRYFDSEVFLFIALDVFNTEEFIRNKCDSLGIKKYHIVILEAPTRGQAETVYRGVNNAKVSGDEALLIFNIDTFRPGYQWPKAFDLSSVDGYLETFIGYGANWSNVLPYDTATCKVKLTAEKKEISKYCCTGLYYWKHCSDFCRVFEKHQVKSVDELQAGELYIAPMYNDLIREGKDIRYSIIEKDEVVFCGVPSEFEQFLNA